MAGFNTSDTFNDFLPGGVNNGDIFGTGTFSPNPIDMSNWGVGDIKGNGLFGGLGINNDTLKLGIGGLSTIGQLWGAFNAASLAKKQYGLQKTAYNQNITDQIQSYNTHLNDIARSRAVVEGQTPDQEAAYIKANQLSKVGG